MPEAEEFVKYARALETKDPRAPENLKYAIMEDPLLLENISFVALFYTCALQQDPELASIVEQHDWVFTAADRKRIQTLNKQNLDKNIHS